VTGSNAPFVQFPGAQRSQGAGHLRHQGPGQAQQPGPAGRGFTPGQRDLRPHTLAQFIRRDPRRGLRAALADVEPHRDPGLQRGRGGLQILQIPHLINHPGTAVTAGADAGQGRDQVPHTRAGSRRHYSILTRFPHASHT
jgi:hypothetical protein